MSRSRRARAARALGWAAVAALALATLAGFLGALHWRADLLSHFRAQYAALALGLGAAAALGRSRRLAAGALALAAVNAACLAPAWVRVRPAAPPDAPRLSLVLANVSKDVGRPERVAALADALAPDVLGLVEVDARWVRELDARLSGYPHRLHAPRDNHFGVALYSRLPLRAAAEIPVNDRRYPALRADLDVGGRAATLLVAHAHPPLWARVAGLRDRQLTRLAEIRRSVSGPFVLLGDLNASPWSHAFRALVREGDLRDTREGRGLQATWPAATPLLRIPVDHCLVSDEWIVVERWVGPDVGSDHLPLFVELALSGS